MSAQTVYLDTSAIVKRYVTREKAITLTKSMIEHIQESLR